MSRLNEVLGTIFLLQNGRQRGLSRLPCSRSFLYLCSLPHTPQTAGSLGKSNREVLGGRKQYLLQLFGIQSYLLCTRYQGPSSYKKSGVSSMGWIWPIIFIPTEVSRVLYSFKYFRNIKSKANRWPFIKKKKIYK